MKIYAPFYYPNFSCKAEKCNHNCCIGWEIDIDKDTLSYYKNLSTPFGRIINNSIECTNGTYHFRLDSKERCPHLNSSNLCDIITNIGEEHLCGICKDHPRFRNFFSTKEEIGLGLCCEEAARIIITSMNEFYLVDLTPNEIAQGYKVHEEKFFKMRAKLMRIVSNRDIDIDRRLKNVLEAYNVTLPEISLERLFGLLLTLECMDKKWKTILKKAINSDYIHLNILTPVQKENLFTYFIYRHLPSGLESNNFKPQIAFAYLSVQIINELCSCMGYTSVNNIIELSRMYSSEIEYSDENLNLIFDFLENN